MPFRRAKELPSMFRRQKEFRGKETFAEGVAGVDAAGVDAGAGIFRGEF